MATFGSAVKLAAVFGAGVATAIFFLSGPVERPVAPPPSPVESPNAPPSPASQPVTQSSAPQPAQDPLPRHPVRVIPIPRPADEGQIRVTPETTGSAKQMEATAKSQVSCNREA